MYTESLTKNERLEERSSHIRVEIIKLTREKNEAEEKGNRYKLKSKVKSEKIKILEDQFKEKSKECENRFRAGETLRKVNEEVRSVMEAMESKIKHMSSTQVKGLETIIHERDQQIAMLKQLLKSSEIQLRTKEKDIKYMQYSEKKVERTIETYN